MNREFRHLVKNARAMGIEVIDRCNLTVLLEPRQEGLAAFLRDHQVHIIASLPCYLESNVDSQRGDEVFKRSIEALKRLNRLGYGMGNDDLVRCCFVHLLNSLLNSHTGTPTPTHSNTGTRSRVQSHGCASSTTSLEITERVQETSEENYGIHFDKLICITNMPINRFYDHLNKEGKLDEYMDILVNAFNPETCKGLMCRDYVNVSWDGRIFDCDFNAQLEMPTKREDKSLRISDIQSVEDI